MNDHRALSWYLLGTWRNQSRLSVSVNQTVLRINQWHFKVLLSQSVFIWSLWSGPLLFSPLLERKVQALHTKLLKIKVALCNCFLHCVWIPVVIVGGEAERWSSFCDSDHPEQLLWQFKAGGYRHPEARLHTQQWFGRQSSGFAHHFQSLW